MWYFISFTYSFTPGKKSYLGLPVPFPHRWPLFRAYGGKVSRYNQRMVMQNWQKSLLNFNTKSSQDFKLKIENPIDSVVIENLSLRQETFLFPISESGYYLFNSDNNYQMNIIILFNQTIVIYALDIYHTFCVSQELVKKIFFCSFCGI